MKLRELIGKSSKNWMVAAAACGCFVFGYSYYQRPDPSSQISEANVEGTESPSNLLGDAKAELPHPMSTESGSEFSSRVVRADHTTTIQPRRDRGFPQATNISSTPFGGSGTAEANTTSYRSGSESNSRIYQLINTTWREFEPNMISVWGRRLHATLEKGGQVVKIQLPGPGNSRSVMRIDRNNNRLTFHGPHEMIRGWTKLMQNLDLQPGMAAQRIRVIDMMETAPSTIRKAVSLLGNYQEGTNVGQIQRAIQYADRGQTPRVFGASNRQDEPAKQGEPQDEEGIRGPVTVETIDELGFLILRGAPEDVAKVQAIIDDIIKNSQAAQPDIEEYPLKNANGKQIAREIQELYDSNFASSNGPVSISPLEQPNGLLLIGQSENFEVVKKLIEKLDVETMDATADFKVFRLQSMSAIDAKQRIDDYFAGDLSTAPEDLPPSVSVIADYRSNSLIVRASPRALAQITKLLEELDTNDSKSVNAVKVFPLKNSVASELAPVLQDVLNGQTQNAGQGLIGQSGNGGGFNSNTSVQTQPPTNPAIESRIRSTVLQLMTTDKNGNKIMSDILFDVRITSDANSNSLIVTAPEGSMNLIGHIIQLLDQIPDIETQIKVFEIVNGDATDLLTTLQSLFNPQNTTGQQGANNTNLTELPLQAISSTDGGSLASLRFGVDARLNTIIVSGPVGDLDVIEDLILRLDEENLNTRRGVVYPLNNAPSDDVAAAINSWIDTRRNVIASDPNLTSEFQEIQREVVVVSEPVSNSLIISATPKYYEQLIRIVRDLDRRPPMVKIKVLIAEVALNNLQEFGVELGVQDSLVFDRGIGTIGFPFNQAGIGNNSDAVSLATRDFLAGQGIANLSVGRQNADLGYGGLVLSAGNESINVLMRALQDRNQLRVLSKPMIMTVENLQGTIQSGARVPRIDQVQQNANGGFTNVTVLEDVGVILGITPRVSPDGTISMLVDVEKSDLGPEESGIPIFVDANGNVVRSPQINIITAQTTVLAKSGQTVVFSGLLQETKSNVHRGIPILSDIPVLGPLFSFEQESCRRSELLIIMTPYLIESDDQLTLANQVEMDRMNWCLCDVNELYGSLDYDGIAEGHMRPSDQPDVYYPDTDPLMEGQPVQPGNNLMQPQQAPQQPPALPENYNSLNSRQGPATSIMNRQPQTRSNAQFQTNSQRSTGRIPSNVEPTYRN